jgi:hypothetical protein
MLHLSLEVKMSLRGFLIIVLLLVTILGLGYFKSGKFQKTKAEYLGYSEICIEGVTYLQFSSGATVKYNKDGSLAACQ